VVSRLISFKGNRKGGLSLDQRISSTAVRDGHGYVTKEEMKRGLITRNAPGRRGLKGEETDFSRREDCNCPGPSRRKEKRPRSKQSSQVGTAKKLILQGAGEERHRILIRGLSNELLFSKDMWGRGTRTPRGTGGEKKKKDLRGRGVTN